MKKSRFGSAIVILLLSVIASSAFQTGNEKSSTEGYKKKYTFTENWFTDRIPYWTQFLSEFKGKPDLRYLEIGTFEGRSSLWLLENILTHPSSKLIVIDGFRENNYKTFISNINLSGEPDKFKVLSGLSTGKIRELPFNSIDIAYIDGSAKGIVMLSDLVNTWDLLKAGGIIICSRYSLDENIRKAFALQPGDPGPFEAIDTFVKMYNPYIKVLAFQENEVFIRKIRQ